MRHALMLIMLLAQTAVAGQPFSIRSCRSIAQQPVVQQHVVVQEAFVQQPQVVNTIVGVPVPVLYSAPIAQQGNTIYGYYQGQTAQPSTVDLAVLYNQANRLAEQAQQLATQANSDFQTLVKLEAQNQQALRLQSQNQISITLKLENGQITLQEPYQLMSAPPTQAVCPDGQCPTPQKLPSPTPQRSLPSLTAPQQTLSLDSVINNKCYNCHNAKNAKGGLSFDNPISVDVQREILERVTSDDPMLSMPRKADGSAAPKLDEVEINVLYQAMGIKR